MSDCRGSAVRLVNATCTSPTIPGTSHLGRRDGDRSYCPHPGGVVWDADYAAAIDLLDRDADSGIGLHIPRAGRQILWERDDRQRSRLPDQDSNTHVTVGVESERSRPMLSNEQGKGSSPPLFSAAVLMNWGLAAATAALLSSGFVGAPPPPSDDPSTPPSPSPTQNGLPGTVWSDISLKLKRDGKLAVTEDITVPDGKSVTRRVPLRLPAGGGVDRELSVSEANVTGHGRVELSAEELTVRLDAGKSTVSYLVEGTVAAVGDGEEVRWQASGGWDSDLDSVTISFIAPSPPRSFTCLSGPVGSSSTCTVSQIYQGQIAKARQVGLRQDNRVDIAVGLEAGTVPPNVRFAEGFSLAKAFALNPVSGAGLAGLVLAVIGGFWLLVRVRGRDARALAAGIAPVNVLFTGQDGHVAFASPDGVLPGEVGAVVDGEVNVVDVTATVVDLAARNYLWIDEVSGPGGYLDWRIVRRNPPDASLTDYERATYEVLLGKEDWVLLSQLRAGTPLDLATVRDDLYADVVHKRWLRHRPDQVSNRWWWAGIGVAVLGAGLTAYLALTTTFGLLGLAVVIAGVALVAAARWIPARSKRGSAVLAQVRGLRDYLYTAVPDDLPFADREMVFSRSLPYAVVLGATDRWLHAFAEIDAASDGAPGLYWYSQSEQSPDLYQFAQRFPVFLAALGGVLARAGHLRGLRA